MTLVSLMRTRAEGDFKVYFSNVPNNQDCTERVLSDLGAHELEGKVDIGSLLILDPFVEIASGENDIVE